MAFFADQSRDQLRSMYFEAWRKRRASLPLEPLEAAIADVIEAHPEYQAVLEQREAPLDRDYLPESGQTNPFLHMGLHLAVREHVTTDRPAGIRAAFESLARRSRSAHEAEHAVIECLAESLWEAQRAGRMPDEAVYLERVRRLAKR